MALSMTWIDRKFSSDLPAWMYPNVIERLRGTPARIEDIIRDLPSEGLIGRDGDAWSIQEHIGHLLDLEPLWIGRVEELLAGKPELRPADLSNRKTYEADHNSAALVQIMNDFRHSRSGLVRTLDAIEDAMIERAARHPRLEQPMRLLDLASFTAEHDDHHLAHITRLKRLFVTRYTTLTND
ncbi:DinB family protein [Oligoflexia bacterium]|nr:DinB family protein [Oligoflexia bacterium]